MQQDVCLPALPLIGAITTIIAASVSIGCTIVYNRWAEWRRMQFDCFRQMLRHPGDHNEFLKAFNETPALYSHCPEVLAAHQRALETAKKENSIINDQVVALMSTMARALGVKGLSDLQLKSRYSSERK